MKLKPNINKIKEFFYSNLIIISFIYCFIVVYFMALFASLNKVMYLYYINGISTAILFYIICLQDIKNENKIKEERIKIFNNYRDITEMITRDMERLYGYSDKMIKDIAIYSKMVENEVDADVANTIVEFSKQVASNNTIILIHIDHKKEIWGARISGKPIYLTQLSAILELVRLHFEEVSGPNEFVIKKTNIEN